MSGARTKWYVLTVRPCSGISTTAAALRGQGFRVVEEAARRIDRQIAIGMTLEDIRKDDVTFQQTVLKEKLTVEQGLPPDEVFILDRALPDSVPYHAGAGLDPEEVLHACRRDFYRRVFFLEPLPYVADYARTETDATLDRLEKELRAVYLDLGYDVVSVPVGPVAERVHRIRSHIELEAG